MEPEPVFDLVQAVAPALLWSAVKFGAGTGLLGLGIGGVAGVIRSKTPILFSIASGIQCFTLGTTYWAARQSLLISEARKQRWKVQDIPSDTRKQASAVAGALSGATTAAIFRGRSSIIPGSVMFALFGYLGQGLYETRDIRQATRTPSREDSGTALERFLKSRWSPVTFISDEDYEQRLSEQLIRVEAEIALIDEQIDQIDARPGETTMSPDHRQP